MEGMEPKFDRHTWTRRLWYGGGKCEPCCGWCSRADRCCRGGGGSNIRCLESTRQVRVRNMTFMYRSLPTKSLGTRSLRGYSFSTSWTAQEHQSHRQYSPCYHTASIHALSQLLCRSHRSIIKPTKAQNQASMALST